MDDLRPMRRAASWRSSLAGVARYRRPLCVAVAHHLDERLDTGTGGVIAVGADGQVVTHFNTAAMPRGVATSGGRFEVAIGKSAR